MARRRLEHKAVAFDVYQAIGGSELRRIWVMRWVSLAFLFAVLGHTVLAMLADRATYNPRRLGRSLAGLRHSPFLTRDVLRHLRAYNKRGFHPDDFDNVALIEHWRGELFGDQGSLTDHLK